VNYGVCFLVGLCIGFFTDNLQFNLINSSTIVSAAVLGSIFLPSFFLLSYSTYKVGVGPTTVANKLSMILPVIFSIVWFQSPTKVSLIGVVCSSILSIYFISPKGGASSSTRSNWYLPFCIFLTGGLIDILLLYFNSRLQSPSDLYTFTLLLFLTASTLGLIYFGVIQRKLTSLATFSVWRYGILLGIPNFFSVYFLLKALQYYENNGAFVFPCMNVSIILVSTLCSIVLFQEKITRRMWAGIGFSALSILLLTL
jgi:drug/metabolite transporter (DMT)-like permease